MVEKGDEKGKINYCVSYDKIDNRTMPYPASNRKLKRTNLVFLSSEISLMNFIVPLNVNCAHGGSMLRSIFNVQWFNTLPAYII